MNPGREQSSRAGKLVKQVVLRQLPTVLIAACISLLWPGYGLNGSEEFLSICAVVFTVAGGQLVLLGLIAKRLVRSLVNKETQVTKENLRTVLRFAVTSSLAAFSLSVLLSAVLFVVASYLIGLGAFTFLIEREPVYVLIQVAFLVVVYINSRIEIRCIAIELLVPSDFVQVARKIKPGRAALWVLLISSGVAVFLSAFVAQEIVTASYMQNARSEYNSLLEAVVQAGQLLPGEDVASVVDSLSPVESITPFVLSDGTATVGISVSEEERFSLSLYVIALMIVALIVAALVAAWFGARLVRFSKGVVDYLEVIPDNRVGPRSASFTPGCRRFNQTMIAAQNKYIADRDQLHNTIKEGRESRDKKSQIFAGMSHDLRGPLNSIIGFTDLLLKGIGGELNRAQMATLSHISQESERLMVLIGDILDTAKLDADRFELDLRWIPSVEILTECSAGANRLVANKSVTFESRLEPGLPPVKVDKDRITRALLSIVSRAVDSMDGGTITLKASKVRGVGEHVKILRVDIIDSGRKIGDAARTRIFRIFNELGGVTQEATGGMGLGLSLARRIVRLHGGEVEVSYTEDRKLTFIVVLPIDDTNEESS